MAALPSGVFSANCINNIGILCTQPYHTLGQIATSCTIWCAMGPYRKPCSRSLDDFVYSNTQDKEKDRWTATAVLGRGAKNLDDYKTKNSSVGGEL